MFDEIELKNGFKKFPETVCGIGWAMTDSNRRHPACKAGALNQLS